MTLPRFPAPRALLLALATGALLPIAAEAQSAINPYLPMTTKPPGPANPAPLGPKDPIPDGNSIDGNTTGVITPPPVGSRMPVIQPRTPSRMPVIPPAGSPGGNPSVIPK